ncbi:MAG: mandelate racemase/muconate lactonizing enzyme family protein [Planctomycetes bacterium]|nr:mandelate racemase/muconate lactonizing enzyme family protein [Planctomycetota bacterium]
MKITAVTSMILRYTCATPIADAQNYFDQRFALLVSITTDTGLTGIGEAATFGGPPATTQCIIDTELAPMLIGRDPTTIERLWNMMFDRTRQHGRGGIVFAAMSGIDVALWDLLGKVAGLPVYKLLGGYTDTLVPYASAGFYAAGKDSHRLADEVESYFQQGFRYAKIKIGRNPGVFLSPLANLANGDRLTTRPEEDLDRVAACCRVAERHGGRIMVDANCAWDTPTAMQMGRQLQDLGVFWLEEPLHLDNVDGSAELCAALDLPIAGYETETGLFRFRRFIDQRAVDIVQPDVIWTGGITECVKIAHYAAAHSLPTIPHAFAGAVSLAANAHFLASLGNGGILEMDRNPNPLRDELVEEPLHPGADGLVRLPDAPGLGVTLRRDAIEKYRVG